MVGTWEKEEVWKSMKMVGDEGKCGDQGRWWEMKGSVEVKEDGGR